MWDLAGNSLSPKTSWPSSHFLPKNIESRCYSFSHMFKIYNNNSQILRNNTILLTINYLRNYIVYKKWQMSCGY